MNGKKFVIIFLFITAICGIGASYWMKHSYDTRPKNVDITK